MPKVHGCRGLARSHAVDEGAEPRLGDAHDVAVVVGEPTAGLVAVVDRREHRAEVEHEAVGVLVVGADHLRDELGRVAADARELARAVEPVPVLARRPRA